MAKSGAAPALAQPNVLTGSMKLIARIILFIFLCIGCSIELNAQQYFFRKFAASDGLGGSSINHIFQDSRGYIWFATQGGGVSRFNGHTFTSYNRNDGLIHNDVTYLAEDDRGNIWIATAGGASVFNGNTFMNFGQKEGLTDGVVYSIYADSSGIIFFALKEGGIKIWDGKKFTSITSVQGLPSDRAYCVTGNHQRDYWFCTAGGVAHYSKGRLTAYGSPIQGKDFFSSYLDSKGNVWFGSIGEGVVVLNKDKVLKSFELPEAVQHDFIGSIVEDKEGNMWFATDHGLLKYNGGTFKLFTQYEGLSVNLVQTVLCDYEGNIWAGTSGGGANLLQSEAFVKYSDADGLSNQNVNCIEPLPGSNSLLAGTGEGLYVFNPSTNPEFTKVKYPREIEHLNITALKQDAKGRWWLCAQEGVFVLQQQREKFQLIKSYTEISSQPLISPHQIMCDSKGNIWLATFGSGVYMLNDTIEKSFNISSGFPSDDILALHEDRRGNIWIGTIDAGVIMYDGKGFKNISEEHHLDDKAIWSIAESDKGYLFFGTGESGVYKFDGKSVASYSTLDGLSSDGVIALAWDNRGNCLWAGSEKGLDRIQFAGDENIKDIHAYKQQDGFTSVGINAAGISVDTNGQVWLATVRGLWMYNPNYDLQKVTAPKIQLTGVRLFYQPVLWTDYTDTVAPHTNLPINITLPHTKNHLTFDIQALTANDVLYTFKLDGQDEDWSVPSNVKEVTYTNIHPRENYVFRAKAINSNGVISDEMNFTFSIRPPWWSTWWFRSLAVVIGIGSLAGFIKARERVLKERNRKLEQTVKHRTLEIAQQKELVEEKNLTLAKTLGDKEELLREKETLLKEIHHRVKNNLQTISSMLMLQSAGLKDEEAKKAITESQNRVRSIALVHQKLYQTDGLEKVELHAFVTDLVLQIKSVYHHQTKQISFQYHIPETHLLIDAAIPLGLILNELLTNSFKYAFDKTTEGTISITLEHLEPPRENTGNTPIRARRAKLTYRDSGQGLAPHQSLDNVSTLGLRLVKLLSQQIGAELNYSNRNGSEFTFTFGWNM